MRLILCLMILCGFAYGQCCNQHSENGYPGVTESNAVEGSDDVTWTPMAPGGATNMMGSFYADLDLWWYFDSDVKVTATVHTWNTSSNEHNDYDYTNRVVATFEDSGYSDSVQVWVWDGWQAYAGDHTQVWVTITFEVVDYRLFPLPATYWGHTWNYVLPQFGGPGS